MHARSCCSSAAHPCAVYPEEAQHPVTDRWLELGKNHDRRRKEQGQQRGKEHTEHRRHDADARVCAGLIGPSYTQLLQRWQTRRRGLCDRLCVLDDHGECLLCVYICNSLLPPLSNKLRPISCLAFADRSFFPLVVCFAPAKQHHLPPHSALSSSP
jgi:hypothetical protein